MNVLPRRRIQPWIMDQKTIMPSVGHVAVTYEHLYIFWGGYTMAHTTNDPVFHDPLMIRVYDPEVEKWLFFKTKGDYGGSNVPMESSGCCGVVHNHYLYVCGAVPLNGNHRELSLFRLNLRTLIWDHVIPNDNVRPLYRNKFVGWSHHDKLYFFGGYGKHPSGLTSPEEQSMDVRYIFQRSDFVHDLDNANFLSWNNQLLCFDLATKVWERIDSTGDVPSPRAAHAAVKINNRTVVLFGGRHRNQRLDDLYTLNLDSNHWRQTPNEIPWPVGRSWHVMNLLDNDRLIMHGGLTTEATPLRDLWLLHLDKMNWTELTSLKQCEIIPPLMWHSGHAIKNNFYIFGGCSSNILSNPPSSDYSSSLFVVKFLPESLKWLCIKRVASIYDKDIIRKLPNSLRLKMKIAMDRIDARVSLNELATQ